MAINLYLKYFHEGKGGLDRMLSNIDSENQLKEKGIASAEHIDCLHPDEKEEGGIEKVIDVGFTHKSYKAAKKRKSKGRLFDAWIKIRQDKYSKAGNAWKIWDSSLVLARWVYENSAVFCNKSVHEVGSGCGLVGLLASQYAKSVVLSDYKPEILDNLRRNAELNEGTIGCLGIELLDFEKVAEDPTIIKDEARVDIVLGSDIVYGLHLAYWLPITLDRLLKDDGAFYGVMPKNRWGIDEFILNMEQLGFHVTFRTLPEKYSDDFVKKSCWDFFVCSKNLLQLQQVFERGFDQDNESSSSEHEYIKSEMLCELDIFNTNSP